MHVADGDTTMNNKELLKHTNEQLRQIINNCNNIIGARTKLDIFVKKNKIDINELFGKSVTKTTKKVAPKWRHKIDNSQTWTGRGRTPKWIKKFGEKI